ncbi:MAG: hypothetical protein NUV74_11590, partial [Candidatus Brocadiaceae bacterium]|nr:hypothetical protein [Candidatus Brocadiaceae bacterium]
MSYSWTAPNRNKRHRKYYPYRQSRTEVFRLSENAVFLYLFIHCKRDNFIEVIQPPDIMKR